MKIKNKNSKIQSKKNNPKKKSINNLLSEIKKNRNIASKKIAKIQISYKKFYSKIFDRLYHENLLYIYDKFAEIPEKYLVIINKKVWDVRILLDLWGNLLCSAEMQNPSPVFPHDPFTKKNINLCDINNILKCVNQNKLNVYAPLKYLLLNYNNIVFELNIPEFGGSFELTRKIINILKERFRFRLINKKNSQDNYTGIWLDKNYPLSDFEVFFEYYDKMSIQIQTAFGDIVDNYEKIQLKKLLDNYPIENIIIDSYYEKN